MRNAVPRLLRALGVAAATFAAACDTPGPAEPATPGAGDLPSFSTAPLSASPVYYDGAHLQVPGRDVVMMYFRGQFYAYPDPQTLAACTGGRTSIIQSTSYLPPQAIAIPSRKQHWWVCSGLPVKSSRSGDLTVYVLEGAVLSGIDTPSKYGQIYGDQNWSRVVTVDPSLLARFPRGPVAAGVRARRAGSLIRNSRGEVSWTTWHGARLGIATADALLHHCRNWGQVAQVSDTEYGRHAMQQLLHDRLVCGAPQPSVSCPANWTRDGEAAGAVLCKRLSRRAGVDAKDYAVVLNLKRGARIHALYEARSTASATSPSPKFNLRDMVAWWSRYGSSTRFCTVNAAYFGVNKTDYFTPTPLSYPLKDLGVLRTTGFEGQTAWTRIFYWDNTAAWIDTYHLMYSTHWGEVTAQVSRGPNALVAKHRTMGDTGGSRDARTFAAFRDDDRDGRSEVVIFYASTAVTVTEANAALNDEFRVKDALLLDSGDSSQLRCNGKEKISDMRDLPQVFGISSAG